MNPNTKELLTCLARRIALAEERDKDQAEYTIERLTLAAVEVLRYELERAAYLDAQDQRSANGPSNLRDIEQQGTHPTSTDIQPVKIVTDDEGLRYVIPEAMFDDFNEDVSSAAFHHVALNSFWKRYLVGYDTDAVQFYAKLPVFKQS